MTEEAGSYRVQVTPAASRDYRDLPAGEVERIAAAIDSLSHDPRPHGSKKLTSVSLYRIRVGQFRVIYEVDDAERVVRITRIRHRSNVYRRL